MLEDFGQVQAGRWDVGNPVVPHTRNVQAGDCMHCTSHKSAGLPTSLGVLQGDCGADALCCQHATPNPGKHLQGRAVLAGRRPGAAQQGAAEHQVRLHAGNRRNQSPWRAEH